MLQAIRERAQGWVAWVIVIFISIPFALWGIQEYLGIGSEPVVASVNGQEITERELNQRYQQFRNELRERLGSAYRPEMFDDDKLRQEVLDDMIRSNVILQATSDMGLRAGDTQVQAAILAVPAFQKDGHFDKAVYERALAFQGMVPAEFEERVRGSLMTSQLSQMVSSSEFTTESELVDAVRLRQQQRSFSYILLPVDKFESTDEVSDAEIQTYYEEHQDAYRVPEQVKLEYLVLDRKAVGGLEEPDDAALQEAYQSQLDSFRTAERRQARHILVAVDQGADDDSEQEAKDKINAIRARIAGGEDFAEVAKEVSEDPGSAGQGGDLGFFEKGLMDPAFEMATFSQSIGELSDPVRSAFGYHLIEVTAIDEEKVKPFEEVREELLASYHSDEADRRYFELAEQLGNLTYESPDSLIPAAEALGLEVQQSDWIGRSGGDGPLSHSKVVGAAFSEDVLKQGNNSELVEVVGEDGQQAVVVRVLEHRESSVEAMEDVKDRIVAAVKAEKTRAAAEGRAKEMEQKIRAGEALDLVAGTDFEVEKPGLVDRRAGNVPSAVLGKAFTLSKSGSGRIGMTVLPDGSAAVIALEEVKNGSIDDLSEDDRKRDRRSLSVSQARTYYDRMVDGLREQADVQLQASSQGG